MWSRMSVRARVILVQAMIVAGLLVWFKVGLPKIQAQRAAAEAAERDQRIEAFVESVVAETGTAQPAGGREPGARPKHLRRLPHVEEVQQAIGAPDTSTTDFRGGQHLTWSGARHKLTGSFNKGRLYSLALEDLRTGRGFRVFESSAHWQEF
jgi:hypothetical protein